MSHGGATAPHKASILDSSKLPYPVRQIAAHDSTYPKALAYPPIPEFKDINHTVPLSTPIYCVPPQHSAPPPAPPPDIPPLFVSYWYLPSSGLVTVDSAVARITSSSSHLARPLPHRVSAVPDQAGVRPLPQECAVPRHTSQSNQPNDSLYGNPSADELGLLRSYCDMARELDWPYYETEEWYRKE